MGRDKSNLNKSLIVILIIMTSILVLLLIIIFLGNRKQKDDNSDYHSNTSLEASPNSNSTNVSEVTSDDALASTDSSGLPQTDDNSDTKVESSSDDREETHGLPDDSTQGHGSTTDDSAEAADSSVVEPIVLAFAGDVNFDEDSKPVARYDKENKGLLGGISQELIDEMNEAEIFMLNNEFAYSTRGKEIIEKSYTFRAHPKRVDILKEMGADIVSLANNHALDFGEEALLDTFTTLDEAGIDYVGAGANMNRAKAPIYYTIGDTTIAYVAASHVIYAMDWYATDERPGMIGTYEPTLFISSIKEAKENSDFVVVYVHWGKERTHEPVDYQKNLAKAYIDAGADAVIGCHPHVMQGIEFYKGKTIAYSLGNYWFNASKKESGLLKIYINPDGTTDTQLLPVKNDSTYTYLLTMEDDRKAYYEFMRDISFNVEYDESGFVSEKLN